MHPNNILIYIHKDATLHSLFYLETALHASGGTITHHHERKQLCLQHLVFIIQFPCCVMWLAYATHSTQHWNCSTCFGWYHHPLSGAQTTVSTASGIYHSFHAVWCGWRTPPTAHSGNCSTYFGWYHHPLSGAQTTPPTAHSNQFQLFHDSGR
jgi:hypothetical protein